MSRSLIGTILLTALVILFQLWRRERQKKAAQRTTRLESQGYAPITMDDAEPDLVTRSAEAAGRYSCGVALAAMILLMAVVAFVAVTEPLVKWILGGTLALMAAIVLVWSLGRRRA